MADLLKIGAAWIAGRAKAQLSETVVYRRGGSTVALQATYGQTAFRIGGDVGGHIIWGELDLLFTATDLILAGAVATPARDDEVLVPAGDGLHQLVYEVAAPAGEAPWRYSDPFRTLLRVHLVYRNTVLA